MTTKGFSLAEFAPEPMTFTDDGFGGDGKVYDVKTVQHLGARDLLRLQQLYNRMSAAMGGRRKGASGKEITEEHLAAQFEQTADDLFLLLIPDLPAARHKAIPFQAKFRFVTWWRSDQATKPTAEGEAEGEAVTDPKPKRARGKVKPKAGTEQA